MLELTLPTMTCGHCVSVVTKAIKNADPEAEVEIDPANHRVRVATAEDRETIESAVAEGGLRAGLMQRAAADRHWSGHCVR